MDPDWPKWRHHLWGWWWVCCWLSGWGFSPLEGTKMNQGHWIREKGKVIKTKQCHGLFVFLTDPDTVILIRNALKKTKQNRPKENNWARDKQKDSHHAVFPCCLTFLWLLQPPPADAFWLQHRNKGWVNMTDEAHSREREGQREKKVLRESGLSEWICPRAPLTA